MARIRTIKPEFFTSEDIVSLSPLARLLYIALWCEADKEGRMAWKPVTFKLRYMPGDNCDINALCSEILERGLVKLYGNGLAYIPTFGRHQHINPRESVSTLPVPPNYVPELPKKITADIRAEVMERDGHKCVRCNATDDLTLDHILPQSLSGPHISENLRCMCRACNSARPVSGKGLADDLQIDGFTVDSLRVKFGIDASRRVSTGANLDVHPQVGREGKGKEGKGTRVDDDASGSGEPLPDLDPEKQNPDPRQATAVTMAGAVCVALKSIGMMPVNPSHPGLRALLDSGADIGTFVEIGRECVKNKKPFAYLLAAVKGRMADSAAMADAEVSKTQPHVGILPGAI